MRTTASTWSPDMAIAGSAPPKVLLVGSGFKGGGTQTRFRLMAEHMFEGRIDAALLQADGVSKSGPGAIIDLGWSGSASYPTVVLRLRNVLRAGGYDAALAMGVYPNTLLWAATRGLRNAPALAMTEVTRPYTESTRFSRKHAAVLRQFLYAVSYRAGDVVAANSEDGAREIAEHYGVARDDILRIPNIVEVDKVEMLARMDVGFRPARPSICMVARLDPIKRIDTLLEAAALLAQGPDDWQVDIVGDGPERERLQSQIGRLGLVDRVALHGWQTNPYPFLSQATASVLCSEYEGFSNTVLESMVLDTPVVTSFCSSDAVQMHETGAALGFPIGESQALASHLALLLQDGGRCAALTRAAASYAQRHHRPVAIAEYEALVITAISRRKLRGAY